METKLNIISVHVVKQTTDHVSISILGPRNFESSPECVIRADCASGSGCAWVWETFPEVRELHYLDPKVGHYVTRKRP